MTARTIRPAGARMAPGRWQWWVSGSLNRWLCAAALFGALVGGLTTPAHAHTHFYFGFSLPVYPYAYAAPYPYYAPPYYAYPSFPSYYYAPAPPPAGWARGHWAWRYDAWGRRVRVWVPAHLR